MSGVDREALAQLVTPGVAGTWLTPTDARRIANALRSQPAPRTVSAAEESLRRDVQTLLPGLLSAELKERWADGSPAQQALRDIQRILGDETGPIR